MKSKNLTLATNDRSNMIAFLSNHYNLTSDYYYTNIGGIARKNFDVFLQFDFQNPYQYNSDIISIGMNRLSKKEQILVLQGLNLNHPETLISDSYNDSRLDDFYLFSENDSDDTLFVVKALNGARGVGSFLVRKDEFYRFLEDSELSNDKLEPIEFCKRYRGEGAYKGVDEMELSKGFIKNREFIVQRKLNIVKEYRVIAGWGVKNPIVYKRKINPEVSWMSNSSIQGKGEHIEDINDVDYLSAQKISIELFNKFKTPFICFDMYIDDNENCGVLEFQMQMGYRDINKNRLINLVRSGVYNLLKYKKVL